MFSNSYPIFNIVKNEFQKNGYVTLTYCRTTYFTTPGFNEDLRILADGLGCQLSYILLRDKVCIIFHRRNLLKCN